VTFHYRSDNTNRPEFGLIAEQVAEVNPELVVRDEKGQIYTVRYDAVNAMLLNEFLKEHWRVEELEKARADEQREITQLKQDFRAALAELTASVKEQDSKIEKVSAQLELTKPEAEMVANHE